jgi:hypothetical protein
MTVAPTPVHGSRSSALRPLTFIVAAALVTFAAVLVLLLLGVFDSSNGSNSLTGVRGSGTAATQTRAVAPFDGVELAGSNDLAIRVGPKQAVVVHADDNLLGLVTTQVHAGSLVIGNTGGSFAARSPMSVEISVPTLEALTLSGSGNISVSGIHTPRFALRVPGSGVVYAGGTTSRLEVTVGGSGSAQLTALVARDVHAVVGGSGAIFVTATNSLDASVPGTGAIVYSGNPARVTTSVTGDGAVTHG